MLLFLKILTAVLAIGILGCIYIVFKNIKIINAGESEINLDTNDNFSRESIIMVMEEFRESTQTRVESKEILRLIESLIHITQNARVYPIVETVLAGTKDNWSRMVKLPSGMQMLQEQHTIKFSKHLLSEANNYSDRIQLDEDARYLERYLIKYIEVFEKWGELAIAWLELRVETEEGITDLGFSDINTQVEKNKIDKIEEEWGWLSHPAKSNTFHLLTKDNKERIISWSPWSIMSNARRFEKLCMLVEKEIIDKGWNFRAVCCLSSSGFPLATFIGKQFDMPILGRDEKSRIFFPPLPPKSKDNSGEILLVDFSIHSGQTLTSAIDDLRNANEDVAGIVTVCYNDLLDHLHSPEIIDIFQERKIVHIFTTSVFNLESKYSEN